MMKTLTRFLLIAALLVDLSYSFYQHLHKPLDGDIVSGALPLNDVSKILEDPLAFKVLINGEHYANPNRYFSHQLHYQWMNKAPLFLQQSISPIDSLYYSAAIFKTGIQLCLLLLIGCITVTKIRKDLTSFLIAMLVAASLIQVNGYYNYMAIIDNAITYNFFYAFPALLLLVLSLPVVRRISDFDRLYSMSPLFQGFLLILIPVSAFSGPLNPGVMAVVAALCLFFGRKKLARNERMLLIYALMWTALSLYIGTKNSILEEGQIPLVERFQRLPLGLFNILSQKPGYLILILFSVGFFLILRSANKEAYRNMLRVAAYLGVFSLAYLLLLPFGGFKNYRPNIIRYDTFIPVLLAWMILLVLLVVQILKQDQAARPKFFIPAFIGLVLAFSLADKPSPDDDSAQRAAFETYAKSKEDVVTLPDSVRLLSWDKVTRAEDSRPEALLLQRWKITDRLKLYYQQ